MSFGFGVGDFVVVVDLVKKIRDRFVNAPAQASALSNDVVNLSNIIQAIGAASYKTSLTEEQKLRLDSISQGCERTLLQLKQILNDYQKSDSTKGVGGQAKRVMRRFDWNSGYADQLRSQLVSHINFFNAFHLELNRDISDATSKTVTQLNSHYERQLSLDQQSEILDWLTPTNYSPQQNDIFSVHQDGTGQWLLSSTEFQQFISDDEATLFLPGLPGAGKTLLICNVVHHLQTNFGAEDGVGIAYIYCNFRRKEEQTALHILANILKQVSQGGNAIPEPMKRLYDCHTKVQSRPTLEELATTLCCVIKKLSKCFFVIDALDELDFKTTRLLLPKLFDIQTKTGLKLMASSRDYPEICRSFVGCCSLQIRATEEDIKTFVEGRMFQLPTFVSKRPDLQERITTKIIEASDGMFLLVALHLDSLIGKPSPKALKRVLEQLPKGLKSLDTTYDKAMERISSQLPEQYELAKQALSWVTYAQRRLSTLELRHALAVEPGETLLDEDNLPDIDDIVSVCAGLVITDEESGIIRLVHYTTQDYFERTRQGWFQNARDDIAQACNTYLSFEVFKAGSCNERDYEDRLTQNPFFDYAAMHWATHLNTVSAEFQPLIPTFLDDPSQVSAIAQVRMMHVPILLGFLTPAFEELDGFNESIPAADNEDSGSDVDSGSYAPSETWSNMMSDQLGGLHLAAWSGAGSTVKALLNGQHQADVRDAWGRTPLLLASQSGHDEVVKHLLEHDANIDARDDELQTALSQATIHRCHSTMILLLDKGAQCSAPDRGNETPLSHAVRGSDSTAVEILLVRGANPNRPDVGCSITPAGFAQWCPPLSIAAHRGDGEIVKLLLAQPDIIADLPAKSGRTALSYAAGEGHHSICTSLLRSGDVHADFADPLGRTPLSYAADGARERAVKLFLGLDRVCADSRDSNGRTPFSYVVDPSLITDPTRSRSDVVKAFLSDDRIDPNSRDNQGRTLFSYAVNGRYGGIDCDIVRVLLADKRIDVDSRNSTGRTPLSVLAGAGRNQNGQERDSPEVLKLLLTDDRVNPNSQDSEGRTPLAWAVRIGRFCGVSFSDVKILLDHKKVDPMLKDQEGHTPLDEAVHQRYPKLVALMRRYYPQDYKLPRLFTFVSESEPESQAE